MDKKLLQLRRIFVLVISCVFFSSSFLYAGPKPPKRGKKPTASASGNSSRAKKQPRRAKPAPSSTTASPTAAKGPGRKKTTADQSQDLTKQVDREVARQRRARTAATTGPGASRTTWNGRDMVSLSPLYAWESTSTLDVGATAAEPREESKVTKSKATSSAKGKKMKKGTPAEETDIPAREHDSYALELTGMSNAEFNQKYQQALELYGPDMVQKNQDIFFEMVTYVKKNGHWIEGVTHSAKITPRERQYPEDPYIQAIIEMRNQTTSYLDWTVSETNRHYYEEVEQFVQENGRWPASNADPRSNEKTLYNACVMRMKKYPNDPSIKKMIELKDRVSSKRRTTREETVVVREEPVVHEDPVAVGEEPAVSEEPVTVVEQEPVGREEPTEVAPVRQTPVHEDVVAEEGLVEQESLALELTGLSKAEFSQQWGDAIEQYGEEVAWDNMLLYFEVYGYVKENGHWLYQGSEIYKAIELRTQNYGKDPYIQALTKMQRRTMSFEVAQVNKDVYARVEHFVQQNHRWPAQNATDSAEQALYEACAKRMAQFPQDHSVQQMITLKNQIEAAQ